MKQRWLAFQGRTIWSHEAIPDSDRRIKKLLRRTIPIFDLILMAFGVGVVVAGSPTITEFFGLGTVAYGIIVATHAFLACVGLVFLINRLEAYAKIVLVVASALYAGLLILSNAFSSSTTAIAISLLCLTPIPFLLWRLGDLGYVKGKTE
jgi:hypothetical protein